MSCYWGYVCRSHDPELVSERWFNRGEELLTVVFHKERAGDWPPDRVWLPDTTVPAAVTGDYLTAAPVYWLREHPRCDVALRNERGETKEIE